ncbi:hypothetical protein AKJ49_01940 [candidate division MSBL1 archaeon SCGC-AAA382A03]|uniref:ATP-cone domain-containing protein n=1 Tax=candidate division MSBL1 archaeon SCGC-AAA382A03 TaxID=1698278 RepID=A0A133VDT3_9EURY|nr:hypothetical protein AKJ49_01940 [candidate division MSBL1 archaeon SCGC-AAA382A03]
MFVVKASGEKEEFDPEKIKRTCLRAGASEEFAEEISNKVKQEAYDGISTKEILHLTLKYLKKKPSVASKYNLKRAIMSLGPTGFPFEQFFAEILQNYGYNTTVGKVIDGKCVAHEIDIVAEKGGTRYLIECKYHDNPGVYTGLKEAMYTYSRLLDLEQKFDKAWLATNTKCSDDARQYSDCVGERVTSWNYPEGKSLRNLIDEERLYPITILKSVNKNVMNELFEAKIMTLKKLVANEKKNIQKKTKLSEKTLNKVIKEAEKIINPN